jgi:hypothetical protein
MLEQTLQELVKPSYQCKIIGRRETVLTLQWTSMKEMTIFSCDLLETSSSDTDSLEVVAPNAEGCSALESLASITTSADDASCIEVEGGRSLYQDLMLSWTTYAFPRSSILLNVDFIASNTEVFKEGW